MTGVADALANAHRNGWALVVASAMRASRDPWLAEECAQDAFLSAVISWQRDGVPPEPIYWLARAARNKVIDIQRREQRFRERMPLLVEQEGEQPMEPDEEPSIPDDRLRLLFLCAHPSLAIEAQLVLMLRLVCGLSVREISLVLLIPAPTVAARLTRAKQKITMASIPFTLPEGDELTARVDGVLTALYLLFTRADDSRRSEDIRLAERGAELTVELLDEGLEARYEAEGLLAVIRLTRARHGAKFENDSLVLLADQDRTKWDWPLIALGLRGAADALGAGQPGKYALQAAIAAVHCSAQDYADTDWPQIVAFYGRLAARWPSPVVDLNLAVAVSHVEGPARALQRLDALTGSPQLAEYPYFYAARADMLDRINDPVAAVAEIDRAVEFSRTAHDTAYLLKRRAQLTARRSTS